MTKTKEEVSIAFYTNWILKFGYYAQVESTNKLLINDLKYLANSAGDNWDVALPIAERAVNTRTHPATLETPFFLWHLREYRSPSQVWFKCPIKKYVDNNQYVSHNLDKIEKLYESVRFSILEDKEKREILQ